MAKPGVRCYAMDENQLSFRFVNMWGQRDTEDAVSCHLWTTRNPQEEFFLYLSMTLGFQI